MRCPILESERLILRAFAPADALDVQTLAGAFEIADTTMAIPHPYEDGMAESWISSREAAFIESEAVSFAIVMKPGTGLADEALVGAISLMNLEPDRQAEVGYWLGLPYWGKGYGTESLKRLVEYAFNDLNLAELYAHHLTRNPASGRVLVKAGFVHEGSRPSHAKKWGKLEDVEEYGMIKAGLI
ncbi:MAG: RimJ/RimL family protein N-acetyltransferase [Candidatus Azotimanducaceae bacterium]|jgi:ribosomal-protein-alanine N-acetyltransferase